MTKCGHSLRRCLLPLVMVLGGCVESEQVPFDILLTQQACTDKHADVSRIELMLISIPSSGPLCVLQRASVAPHARVSRSLQGGALEDDEVLLAAIAYDSKDCARCHALARVLLAHELTRYSLDLEPAENCEVPKAVLQGLGLSLVSLPPADCP